MAQHARERRAQLKVFFGYAPGVGKTHAMLEAARRAKQQGGDVVVGLVETHGRDEIRALMSDLEILPRLTVDLDGERRKELDLDAAKARKPDVLLVDELAHTNAPGSRHHKRGQDVLELLDQGIDVWTTLNVQHVESLNDAVAKITHVVVSETVPDALLDRADEIELVDIPLDELLARARDGKVRLGAQLGAHQEKRGDLVALRELALLRTAARIDDDVRAFRDEHEVKTTWPTAARLLVCVGASPTSVNVIRAARRMADDGDASWAAAWVESPLTPLSETDRERLDAHLKLAAELGARIVHLSGPNVAEALIEYAHDENITQIVVGRPHGFSWRDVARGPLVQQLLRAAHDIDIRVVSDKAERGAAAASARRDTPRSRAATARALARMMAASALVAVATLITWAFGLERLAEADVVLVYLVVITIAAVRFGRGASILAAALSVAAFDFFFVRPFFTFSIADARHALTFAMMFVVGLFVSTVAARLRRQELEASSRERRTQSVLALTNATAAAQHAIEVAVSLSEHAAAAFQRETAVLLPNDRGDLVARASVGIGGLQQPELRVAQWVSQHGRPAGRGTDTLPESVTLALPLASRATVEGVLVLLVKDSNDISVLDASQRELADAFARQTAAALERLRLSEAARVAALKMRTEEMRTSLLSSVSHDLRTPLGAITGAATTLLEDSASLPEKDRRALLESVAEQGFALERLVASLLDMTRVESGALVLRREWIPVDELVGSALARTRPRLDPRTVRTQLDDVPLLHVDPILFEQVLVNLLDNEAKYTPPESTIEITARVSGGAIELCIVDDGPGLPGGVDIFEKFVRGPGTNAGGLGLGLAICKSVVDAHGGTITGATRATGGACFTVRLPVPPTPPMTDSA
jgi:two-component system, OmpR family, sensor histidine kinase KdpD